MILVKKKPTAWVKHSSKVILDHELLGVSEDVVILPDGKKSTYVRHSASQHHSVIVIAVNKNKKILIQQEYSYPPNKVMWQLPGGSMKPRESVRTAALRELAEESGYRAKDVEKLGFFYVHNRLSDQKQYVVLCQELYKHKLAQDADEFIVNNWMTKQQLIKKISDGQFNNINLLAALNIWFFSSKA